MDMDRTVGPQPETTAGKALRALAVGAVAGAPAVALVTAAHWAILVLGAPVSGSGWALMIGLIGVIGAIVALPAMAAGLAFLAVPAWALLHRCGMRSARAAMLLGAVLTGVTAAALAMLRWYPPPAALSLGLAQACVGACLGLLVWRLAYR